MYTYHPSTLQAKGEDSKAGAGASLGYNGSTFLKGNKTLYDSVSNIANNLIKGHLFSPQNVEFLNIQTFTEFGKVFVDLKQFIVISHEFH